MKIITLFFLSGSLPQSQAFLAPSQSLAKQRVSFALPSSQRNRNAEADVSIAPNFDAVAQPRREFLYRALGTSCLISALFPAVVRADDDYLYKRGVGEGGDLTSQLFNPDGSLRDPNMVVEAKEKAVELLFSASSATDGLEISVAEDGVQKAPPAADVTPSLRASYKLPLKWNQDASSELPLYYDSSEGKNGKSCNRISIYSVSAPKNLDMSVLEKASRVGVAKSLFMDQIPDKYFDQGVLKADLIGGRTVRKPIRSLEAEGEFDEQVYYEFDLAFAPLECPDFMEGNRENLGLGFCPYDNIFLISATVLASSEKGRSGTMMCSVVECNKDEWKLGNSDLKRVRSSFTVERV